ncbi:MAG: glucosaminidase domain-containing protein [Candidatus Dormibacteraeota bacterium]|nr:glucosaminidase domain-containing protein [Candidatus Dormibacteraeota bacterium]
MGLMASWAAHHRLACALPATLLCVLCSQPVAADNAPPTPDAQTQVNNAQQALSNAQNQAGAEDSALAAAQASLASYTAQLNALQARIASLNTTIAADTADYDALRARLASDHAHLAAYVRTTYENGGSEAALVYLISSKDIATAIQRKEQLDHVATAVQQLVDRVHRESARAQQVLDAATQARTQLTASEQQVRTQQVLVAVQTQQVEAADSAAHEAVNQAAGSLSAAQATLAAQQAAQRAADNVFSPIAGSQFTVDTDLTQPSGETSARLDSFLSGTPMAGLGDSFMHAEQAYHVSARYFVAHAILESDWGQSPIAHDKHNLFGFNADDSNPYNDATTFQSFDACIQFVAQFIATNYLAKDGPYYHGPTLRGMNVDYATDPDWANKIARIAQTIP